jgi:hypothetical protein
VYTADDARKGTDESSSVVRRHRAALSPVSL